MRSTLIELFEEYLEHHPSNQFVRFILADHLVEFGHLSEAESEFCKILDGDLGHMGKAGLARVNFISKGYGNCKTILEQLLEEGQSSINILGLLAKSYLLLGELEEARSTYLKIISLEPYYSDHELEGFRNME